MAVIDPIKASELAEVGLFKATVTVAVPQLIAVGIVKPAFSC